MSQAREMTRLTKELDQAAKFRKSAVDTIREATKQFLASCDEMRGEMVHDYRAQMAKFLSGLSREVAAQRKAMAHQIVQTQKYLGNKARNVAAQRNATMNQIARFGSNRSKAASRLRSGLQQDVENIVMQTADAISHLSDARRKMAKQQRSTLKSAHRKLHKDMAAVVKSNHADRMKAEDVWAHFKHRKAA